MPVHRKADSSRPNPGARNDNSLCLVGSVFLQCVTIISDAQSGDAEEGELPHLPRYRCGRHARIGRVEMRFDGELNFLRKD